VKGEMFTREKAVLGVEGAFSSDIYL